MVWPKQDRWRQVLVAGLVGLSAVAAAAVCLQYAKRGRRRRRTAPQGDRAPTLADEIREALARESAEGGADPPSEEAQEEFARAAAWVSSDAGDGLSTDAKLALYGCYKQAAAGDAPAQRPRGGIEASMKWDAWRRHAGASRAEAMRRYVAELDRLAPGWRHGLPEEDEEEELVEKRHKPDGSSGLGLSVSTMGRIGDDGDVDETPVGQLCEKIAEGLVQEASAILRRQPGLACQKDKDGMSPLHWAADRGELDVAKALVAILQKTPATAVSVVNARDASGDTALHYAINTDNLELAKVLVAAGADPRVANEDGETALQLADGQEAWEALFKA